MGKGIVLKMGYFQEKTWEGLYEIISALLIVYN